MFSNLNIGAPDLFVVEPGVFSHFLTEIGFQSKIFVLIFIEDMKIEK